MARADSDSRKKPQKPHPEGALITISKEERTAFKDKRTEKKLKQSELAGRIGVSNGTISNIENGKHLQVKATVYFQLRRVLFGSKGAAAAVDRSKERELVFKQIVEAISDLTDLQLEALLAHLKTFKKPE